MVMSKRWLATLGISACVACCTVPLLSLLGLSVSLGSGIAIWQGLGADIVCIMLIGIGICVFLFFGWRKLKFQSQVKHKGCSDSCEIDHHCCGAETARTGFAGCSLERDE